ncbi:amidohydrolase [Chitinophaga barathri]|uniref:Amidohydrolase n=1 Tax=Chitinophaga barathri TaxID=1647451 RepID=A0A3N4MLJ8_9BACT|nr:amidohydrolase [Chitinophaga barathri]RPD40459.1 amidohydrolase [Chitinophaga barathri]
MKQSLYVALFVTLLSACARKEKADLIVHHAVIYTADSLNTVAAAMAVKDGKVMAIGTNELIQGKFEADSVVDAKGAAVFPGFNDAHAHFFGYANSLRRVDLVGAKSWDEVVGRVRDFAAKHPSAWVLGRGWDQNDWEVKTFPDKSKLDSLFPHTPVLLERVDGHASIANQAALDAAGVKAGQTLTGGTVETRNGKLTGILVDNADELVSSKIPEAPLAEIIASLEAAERNCIAAGITSITDCGLNLPEVRLFDTLFAQNKLHLRLNVMLSDNEENISWLLKNGIYEKDRLLVRSIKFYGDGASGSRGACLKHDYTDRPGWKGFLLKDAAYFAEKATLLAKSDIQMCTHAIGDSANSTILKIYADVLKGKNDKRWRIEHAQVVDSIDFHWFGENNIVPSVQPTHATSDMYWAEDRLGPQRVKYAYAFQDLLRQNGWIPLGTDFPVEHIDPLRTFYAAVARKDQAGFPEGGFQPENALSREDALKGMTIWAAKASFEENRKGSLEPGKLADFVILDQDIMKVPAEKILATKVLATYIYGQAHHRAGL